jgi:hypothetical protein
MGARQAMGNRHVAEALVLVMACLSLAGAKVMAFPAAPPSAGAPMTASCATVKAPPVKSFRFVAFGDYQGEDPVILNNLKKEAGLPAPSFYLNTGDIATLGLFGGKFPYGKLYPARGNNDDLAFWETVYPLAKPAKNYYSFTYLNSHFVFLYSGTGATADIKKLFPAKSPKPNCLKPISQTDWFSCDLQQASKDPAVENIFVVLHVPPLTYAVPPGYGPNPDELKVLGPIFNEHPKLRAVMSGHNHFYQRLLRNGINYLVIGGAGAPLYTPSQLQPAEVKKQAKKYHFAIFDVDGSKVTLSAIGYDNQIFAPIETVELSCKSCDKRKVPCKPPLGYRTDTCVGGRWVAGNCEPKGVPTKCTSGYRCCEPVTIKPEFCYKCVKATQACP